MGCLFCDFIKKKRKKHTNNLPFLILNTTKNTLSFLATDIPATEEGHVLVIPKKHVSKIEHIPKNIQHELIDHVFFISRVLKKTNEGCNILLNEGKSAGQYIPHVHFHIIPRNFGDNIKIEVWKNKKLDINNFKRLHNNIKRNLRKYR